jgi:hypothetical protein
MVIIAAQSVSRKGELKKMDFEDIHIFSLIIKIILLDQSENLKIFLIREWRHFSRKKPVHGIKGPSFLMGLKCYDYVKSTCNDYMHCVLLGMTKKLTSLWFSSTSSTESFSLFKHLDTVDNRLSKIKPSYHITRKPRGISEHLKFWKASEFSPGFCFIQCQC